MAKITSEKSFQNEFNNSSSPINSPEIGSLFLKNK